MSNHFLTKLVPGHKILSAQKPELLSIMHAHLLLTPTCAFAGGVAKYREFCAALIWADAGAFSLAAVKQLPPVARITLCDMLGIVSVPTTPVAQSERIFKYMETKRASAIADRKRAAAALAAQLGAGGGGGSGAPGAAGAAPQIGGAAQPQVGQAGGGGAGGGAENVAAHSLSGLVIPAQEAIICALPIAVVRALVTAASIPLLAADSDHEARCKLRVAVWAGEAKRTSVHVRQLAGPDTARVLAAVGANQAWAASLQDGYMDTTFQLCRQAAWVADPSQNHGLLSLDLLACLAFLDGMLA